ncbi:tRNA (adenosine(37)-N6)-threonylcarbamoyltransferase complex ATPase subunit type 1 TsaE [Marilutibacter alkalisoli]|uniref:tRNA threonylcarbamoyladenosine biosynthesis protein TsaE n=1 Tax=Marilutibacter alkalisoli TaxID=2591633 RepID=A0A514BQW0_9GAMM|nr:tRNA (adenosine(37)-N6)-threonylcarbamoyltransferase complex ATPase subunit type 1 TsaE [Lysobacter alkalisoli]QDH69780.1 tRNA (adenosine(37)-N6)-threonylcarbamoyltransferase complex ATPase subunit type 1 TsaE [Lysobacter alkalisoli]
MTSATRELYLADPAATEDLGRELARTRPARAVVHLRGDLGSGKSTLARALLRELGVTGTIRSPTYTLVERYPLAEGGEAWHLDLYRIADAGELEYLGLDADGVALWLVEWPERGAGALPPADLLVELAMEGEGRHAHLVPASAAGASWLARSSADG